MKSRAGVPRSKTIKKSLHSLSPGCLVIVTVFETQEVLKIFAKCAVFKLKLSEIPFEVP
jgi:hypothetical protein